MPNKQVSTNIVLFQDWFLINDKWHHISVCQEDKVTRRFVDGVLQPEVGTNK